MVSLTRQTKTRRQIRSKSAGKATKRSRALSGTPAFAVHPEGYDKNAADAKPAEEK